MTSVELDPGRLRMMPGLEAGKPGTTFEEVVVRDVKVTKLLMKTARGNLGEPNVGGSTLQRRESCTEVDGRQRLVAPCVCLLPALESPIPDETGVPEPARKRTRLRSGGVEPELPSAASHRQTVSANHVIIISRMGAFAPLLRARFASGTSARGQPVRFGSAREKERTRPVRLSTDAQASEDAKTVGELGRSRRTPCAHRR